jgi:hypothetical protein
MCVQPNALGRKAIQYIVLYCLTPPRFHRYSSSNLCPPFPAGEIIGLSKRRLRRQRYRFGKQAGRQHNEQLATDNWPLATAFSKEFTLLKLKRLQILGFKSFCDRTDLKFHGDGIAAIIGPNGCGKSNIADAISWVLGEQSAKTLRGSRMEDVIFAGTRDRKPTGMAEVSLTLIDPEEYPGPMPMRPPRSTFRMNFPSVLRS